MLKLLGWLFLIGGGLIWLTLIFIPFGAPFMVVGALLLVAGAISSKRKQRDEFPG